ncbi:arylalkylamine N-acetyltransferase 1-like [Musca vetustissima]|uniref:arylalkylamine N-acetyltransferase 1-like n=1 Tax=Musca vetustissima TaxID=27455 RepID=UPI002AB79511|nr:arylalkylamine N-acetyltransferase 1-like [Musca vetustissima]
MPENTANKVYWSHKTMAQHPAYSDKLIRNIKYHQMDRDKHSNIQLRRITQTDCQQVYGFLKLYFFQDEPLSTCFGPDEERGFGETILSSLIDSELCLMAIDEETNELIGVILNDSENPEKKKTLPNYEVKTNDPTGEKIHKFLTKIRNEADLFQRYQIEKLLHLIIVSVKKEWRGKGIASLLSKAVVDMGKEKGFELISVECTSLFTAKMFQGMGWDLVHTIYYKDFLDENMEQVFTPLAPHDGCRVYAKRL